MANVIELPSYGGLHFGNAIELSKFKGCWFEERKSTNNFISKAIIIEIKYKPDEVYNKTDGSFGRCWMAHVEDFQPENEITTKIFSFRNFGDLAVYYEKLGFKFTHS